MLAYSSVAQAGYMLAGVVVATQLGVQATVFYLAVYLFMNMAAFAVIVARERETEPRRLDRRDRAASGASGRWLAWPMTISMLGLAGIPATAGFIGKFYLIDAAVAGGYAWLGVVIVIGSMISLGYYLPVIAAMWMREAPSRRPGEAARPHRRRPGRRRAAGARGRLARARRARAERASRSPSPRSLLVAVLAGAATIFFGIIPQPLFDLVHGAGSALGLF